MFLTTIRFTSSNIPHILAGKKTATIRLWETKKVDAGDLVILTESHHGQPFAVARITSIERVTFDEMDDADKNDAQDNLPFEEFAKRFASFYDTPITRATKFFLVRFRIIDDGQKGHDILRPEELPQEKNTGHEKE